MYRTYDEETLKKLQVSMLDILRKFDGLCEKYGIKYIACGGTLLGAVRHKGFIPWDDDMDIGMLREEYDKFLAIPKSEYEDLFELRTPESGMNYYNLVSKFYQKNTRYISELAKADGQDMGIFIEIFPFEGVSDNEKQRNRQLRKVRRLKLIYTCISTRKIVVLDKGLVYLLKYTVKALIKIWAKLFHITPEKLEKKYNDLTISDEKTELVRTFSDQADGFMRKREWFEDLIKIEFEDYHIYIPRDYDDLLHKQYGNYMQLPPEGERENHAVALVQFADGEVKEYHD